MCSHVIPYVDALVAVTVMRELLFVFHVCMLRECEGVRVRKSWCGRRRRYGCGESGHEYGYVHVVQGLCLAHLTC